MIGAGLRDGEKLVSHTSYTEYKVAMKAAMLSEYVGNYRRHLFRTALKQGIFSTERESYGRVVVTLPMLSEWTGYSAHVLRSWLTPKSARKSRSMPVSAIRHIILELSWRDQGRYDWDLMLRKCR